jgi:hypothetical protein
MPQTITVNIPHRLGKAEAKRRIQEGFGALKPNEAGSLLGLMSFEKRWGGDRLDFEANVLGQRIAASLDVGDDAVQLRIQVPDLLSAFVERIKESVKKETVKALENQK